MAAVPIVFSGVFYPKDKKKPPLVGTFVGNAAIYGLHPDNTPPEQPPGEGEPPIIWGPPDPLPGWGLPDTPPPPEFPDKPGLIKPFPEEGGWGYSERTGWVYKPGEGQAGPKR